MPSPLDRFLFDDILAPSDPDAAPDADDFDVAPKPRGRTAKARRKYEALTEQAGGPQEKSTRKNTKKDA